MRVRVHLSSIVDQKYLRKAARTMDSSKLQKRTMRQNLVEFAHEEVSTARQKAAAKEAKIATKLERLSKIQLMHDRNILSALTVAKLEEQIAILRLRSRTFPRNLS